MSTPKNPQVALSYGPSVTLQEARSIVADARAHAAARGWPMAIAVVDAGGHLVCLERMDDTQLGSVDVALHKAVTAARFRRPTRAFEAGFEAGTLGLRAMTMGVSAIEGGVPLVREGRVVGAVGVSGMMPQEDGEVAAVGAQALGG